MSTEKKLENQFVALIAEEVGCRPGQVESASELFAEGATVPFVARYRKEATEGLIDEQLEQIAKKRVYYQELTDRRDSILQSIEEQGKLTDGLASLIKSATTKQLLEDLYLPYKKKRRTRAQIARERGLEPLADAILEAAKGQNSPNTLAEVYISAEKDVEDVSAALAGARDILAEKLAEKAENRERLRRAIRTEGQVLVRVLTGKETEGAVYRDYFEYDELASKIPSHRLLAVLRGEREGFLISDLEVDDDREVDALSRTWDIALDSPCGREVRTATEDGYKRLLRPSITNEIRSELRDKAEAEAISVFRENLQALLMQSPLGDISVMGLDPAYRTGCKLATVDVIGRVHATGVIYPIKPQAREAEAMKKILELVDKHNIKAIAIGNGTGSRETEIFVRKVIKESKRKDVIVAIVPETGASVYSASALAREELPDLDVSIRGAVSIARRLQDPLAELVKIEPKSLGIGQYQHDVNQKSLAKELDFAVEGVVNHVGVELNTASYALLRRVSGVSERIAKAIVAHRDKEGSFASRKQLLKVKGFGPKAFELSAGFLRVRGGKHPLDATAVHPERYALVKKMAEAVGIDLSRLVGNQEMTVKLDLKSFVNEDEGLGLFTLEDIRKELQQPGRDPRPAYKAPVWRDDVQTIGDLEEGMILEGRVSNVTNFGAFVDIGVKRDGLVHLSELASRWIDDPRTVVKVSQIVKVKVMEVDHERGRIGLSMKALDTSSDAPSVGSGGGRPSQRPSENRGGERSSQRSPSSKGSRSSQGRKKQDGSSFSNNISLGNLMSKFNK